MLWQALGEAAVDTRRASSHLLRGSSLDLAPWASSDRFAVGGDFAVASAGAGARLSARGVYADAVDRDNWDHAAQGTAPPQSERAYSRTTILTRAGDSPASLAARYLGSERGAAALLALNGFEASVRGARSLPVGAVLDLPAHSEGAWQAGGQLLAADARWSEARSQMQAAAQRQAAQLASQNSQPRAAPSASAAAMAGDDFYGGSPGSLGRELDTDTSMPPSRLGARLAGTGELLAAGAWNTVVRITGGAASVPYLVGGVQTAVDAQQAWAERFNMTPSSEGAALVAQAFSPVARDVGTLMRETRGYSERTIGQAGPPRSG